MDLCIATASRVLLGSDKHFWWFGGGSMLSKNLLEKHLGINYLCILSWKDWPG